MTQPTELVVNVAIDFAPVDGTRNRFVFTKVKLERRHGDEQQILAGKDVSRPPLISWKV